MKGIIINCAICNKPLLKNAYLRPGSFLTLKCYHCGSAAELFANGPQLVIKVLAPIVDKQPLTDSDDDDIVMLKI